MEMEIRKDLHFWFNRCSDTVVGAVAT